ncbi:MAG TPA: DUF2157 domain-containing protein [Vicinamibacterales bacterium]
MDPLNQPATPARLRAALAVLDVPDTEARAVFAAAAASPSPAEWARFGLIALLFLGAGLLLAGIVTFFAFNWDVIGRFGRFAALQAAIVVCALAGWRRLEAWTGRIALFAAAALIGPLLGVYGQTYQTGADLWGLFAAWAALSLPWAIAARFAALWVLVIGLVDIAAVLYAYQAAELTGDRGLLPFLVITIVHVAAVAAWEAQRYRARPWLDEVWAARLLLAAGLIAAAIPAIVLVLGFGELGPFATGGLVLFLALTAAVLAWYRTMRRDLFMLTAAAGTLLVFVTFALFRVLFKDLELDMGAFFLMALVVVVEVVLAVMWLRSTARAWQSS